MLSHKPISRSEYWGMPNSHSCSEGWELTRPEQSAVNCCTVIKTWTLQLGDGHEGSPDFCTGSCPVLDSVWCNREAVAKPSWASCGIYQTMCYSIRKRRHLNLLKYEVVVVLQQHTTFLRFVTSWDGERTLPTTELEFLWKATQEHLSLMKFLIPLVILMPDCNLRFLSGRCIGVTASLSLTNRRAVFCI